MDIDKKKPAGPVKKTDMPPRDAADQELEEGRGEMSTREEGESTFQSPEPGLSEEEYIDEGAAQTK